MISLSFRPVGVALLVLSLAACTGPVAADATTNPPVLGIDLGARPGVAAPARTDQPMASMVPHPGIRHDSNATVMAHDGAHGTGTVNSIDPTAHKVNLSHQAIPQIGWPAMTMDFAVDPAIDLRAVRPGSKVDFTIEQGAGGMYEIKTLKPAGGAP